VPTAAFSIHIAARPNRFRTIESASDNLFITSGWFSAPAQIKGELKAIIVRPSSRNTAARKIEEMWESHQADVDTES
jgi:hypothetical protein